MISKQQQSRKNAFTLVELLATMGILVLMMLFLFQFVFSAESAWSRTSSNTRVYENARIAMDLIQRDLKSAIVSDFPGQEIPFYADSDGIVFVSATGIPSSGAESKLTEISYREDNGFLYRRSVSDSDDPDWDFYGETSDGWESTTSGDDELIGGVDDFRMLAYDSDGDLIDPSGDATKTSSLPAYVMIELSIFDENLMDQPEDVRDARKEESLRTFTKIVYLGN